MSRTIKSLLGAPLHLGVALLVLLGGAWAAWTIRLDTEFLPLLPSSLPSVRGLDDFQRRFASDREVLLVADPAMPEAIRAAAFRTLRPVLATLPGVGAVVGPGEEFARHWPELAAWGVWNLPPDRFDRVVAALSPERARARLASLPDTLAGVLDPVHLVKLQLDPLGLLEVLDTDSSGRDARSGLATMLVRETPPFLVIRAAAPLVSFEECIALTDALHSAIARTLPGEARLLLTGRPVITAEIARQMRRDMLTMLGVAAALICGAFWLFYRTLRPLGWILLVQILALLSGLTAARLVFGELNVISMGFASILLGVGMDYCILVYHHFASLHRSDPVTWARLKRGIWFSAATTAASFLILGLSSFPGLRQLAILVAAGLIASAFFATWLLGAVLKTRPPTAPGILERASHVAADLVMRRRRRPLLAATLLVALCAVWLIGRGPERFYKSDLSQFRPAGGEAWRGQELLLALDAGARDAIYLIRGRSWEDVRTGAERLAMQVSGGRISPWSFLLPSPVHQVANRPRWPTTTVAGLQTAFREAGIGEDWSRSTLAFATALEAAVAGDSAAFRAIAPLLRTLASEKDGVVTAVVRVTGAGEHPMPPGGFHEGGVDIVPVSWVVLQDELSRLARHDVNRLSGWMAAALVALCALAQRSVRLVVLNIVALVLALLLLAVFLAATDTAMSPLSLLAIPLLLGLVIDYSLHILMALEHSGGNLRHTYSHLAAPVVLTGLSSGIGFGAPLLTGQPALRNFGLVMDFGILAAVMVCLFLLPTLYRAITPAAAMRDQRVAPLAPPDALAVPPIGRSVSDA